MSAVPPILSVPEIALEKILSFLSYDDIAKNRLVCNKFNQIGGKLLTRGFLQVERRHAAIYKKMKSMLPRRESERSAHPMARHCNILSAIQTRLSMLTITYMKYIESNACCFIPGKVIDETDRILTLVERVDPPPITHELFQELRDISSMAMEHFEEVILPRLKQKIERSACSTSVQVSKSPPILLVQQDIANEIHKMREQSKCNKQQITVILDHLKKWGAKYKKHTRSLHDKTTKIREQERKIQEQTAKIQEQEATIADLKKHVEEWDQKFSDLTAELIRAKESLISKSAAATPRPPSPSVFRDIRARTVLPKFHHLEQLERKRKSALLDDVPSKMPKIASEDIMHKINENITSNISKNITGGLDKPDAKEKRRGFGPFLSSSIELLLKAPISSIKSRKRKMTEDIDMK